MRRPAMATKCTEAGRGRKAEYTQKWYVNRQISIQVFCGSCNGESSGLSFSSVACVSHELHARKILDKDDEICIIMNKRGPNCRPRSSLTRAPS